MKVNEEKFSKAYDYLVDLTEDTSVLHNKEKDELLSKMLSLFEYLGDTWDEDTDPIPNWFK